ncbi:MAG: oligosaccharide flippase family protein [Alkalibacterium sp.]|nr:oligosaccharide flippase family protein [Alkalibacterium sp.]
MNYILKKLSNRKPLIIFSSLKLLIMILGFITNIIIIRNLSVNDYGVFSLTLMFVGLITTFGFSWSSSSILYYGSREKAKFGNLNKTFWSRNIIMGTSLIITTVLFIVFRRNIVSYIGIDVTIILLLWLYVSVAEDYLNQYFLAVKKQLLSGMLSVTAKVLYLLIILIIPFEIKSLIILNIISHASVLLYSLKINKKDIGKFEFDKEWFKEILNFSMWQFFGFSGLYLINFGDTAVIRYYMTTEDVGVYNAGYKLFNTIANFSFVISSFYAGNVSMIFAENNKMKIRNFFYKERILILSLSTFVHILVMLTSNFIIPSLYGEDYRGAVIIFNILMIGSIFKYFSTFYMLYFNTNGKHKIQQTLNIFRAVLNVLLNVYFIRIIGLIGPAVATTLAILITLVISAVISEKEIRKLSKNL